MLTRLTPLVTLIFVLAGCSSLRVDVDVYKGPLTNEPPVQIEQMASMALGVKPLLDIALSVVEESGSNHGEFAPYLAKVSDHLIDLLAFYMDPGAVQAVQNACNKLSPEPTQLTASLGDAMTALRGQKEKAEVLVQTVQHRYAQAIYPALCETLERNPDYCVCSKGLGAKSLDRHSSIARIEKVLKEDDAAKLKTMLNTFSTQQAPSIKDRIQCNFTPHDNLEQIVDDFRRHKGDAKQHEKLTDRLIDFAERARTMGNHALLFVPLLPGQSQAVWESGGVTNTEAEAAKIRKAVETLGPVLQTVGNAILSQANEVVRRGKHIGESNALADREMAIWRSTLLDVTASKLSKEVETVKETDWFDTNLRKTLLEKLAAMKRATGDVDVLLGKASLDYRQAAADLPDLERAMKQLQETDCTKKTSGKTLIDAMKACLGDTSREWLVMDRVMLGQKRLVASEKYDAAKVNKALTDKIASLNKQKGNAELFELWKAKLDYSLVVIPTDNSEQSTVQAMDSLMSSLRAAETRAVLVGDAVSVTRMREAYKIVEAHRAGKMYLLPASAYLRNSHPATSIQRGTNQSDRYNMLWDSFLQGFPNISAGSMGMDEKLRADQDKAYWEQVNTVHLSGAGNTNQVLVKDDVGNWYVKSYAEDKTEIFNSMKNLALYSMRGKLGSLRQARNRLLAGSKDLDINTVTIRSLQADKDDATAGTTSGVFKAALRSYAVSTLGAYRTWLCTDKVKQDQNAGTAYECDGEKLKARRNLATQEPESSSIALATGTPVKAVPDDILDFTLQGLEKEVLHRLNKTSLAPEDMKKSYETALKKLAQDLDLIGQSLAGPLPAMTN